MSKFNIGDKVITTKQGIWYDVGEVFTLTKPYHDTYNNQLKGFHTEEKGGRFFISLENMTLCKLSLKSMLQNGMRVKLRNNLMYTYIDGYFTDIKITKDGLNYLSEVESWADDLRYYRGVDVESEWDVMEIFAKVNIYDYFNNNVKGRVIWKREEKSAKQLQLEALQKQAQEVADAIKKLQDEE
jgi:hypothetical protein